MVGNHHSVILGNYISIYVLGKEHSALLEIQLNSTFFFARYYGCAYIFLSQDSLVIIPCDWLVRELS